MNFLRSNIFTEYLLMIIITVVFFATVIVITNKNSVNKETTTNTFSCANLPMPRIELMEEYEDSSNSSEVYTNESPDTFSLNGFKTYTDKSVGFSFQYPSHMEVGTTQAIGNHIILSYSENTDDYGKIIVSIGLNDENMPPEEWLFGNDSGYIQSRDYYGDCYKTFIGEQEAVYTDGGMWVVVNTPDSKFRLSIADLTKDGENPPFTEIGTIVETLTFLSN